MKSCPECHVLVADPQDHCPLCNAKLLPLEGSEKEEYLYPDFSQPAKQRSRFPFLAKLFAFLSAICILICGIINLAVDHQLTWSLYVIGAIVCLWTSVGFHFLSDTNLNNKLLADLLSLSVYLILVDKLTGWNRWSINYVIPILYIGIMITVIIMAIVFREFWREYILSLVTVCVMGIGPLLIFFSNDSPIRYLCLAAALMAGVLMLGLLYFASGKVFSEWRRRMNL